MLGFLRPDPFSGSGLGLGFALSPLEGSGGIGDILLNGRMPGLEIECWTQGLRGIKKMWLYSFYPLTGIVPLLQVFLSSAKRKKAQCGLRDIEFFQLPLLTLESCRGRGIAP